MKTIVVLCMCVLAGCVSINRGDFKLRSVGTDNAIDKATWTRNANGVTEVLTLEGAKRDSSTSMHIVANLALGILGAIAGSPGGLPGSAIGASAGVAVAEVWQTGKDRSQK